jgi:hypothetical protein
MILLTVLFNILERFTMKNMFFALVLVFSLASFGFASGSDCASGRCFKTVGAVAVAPVRVAAVVFDGAFETTTAVAQRTVTATRNVVTTSTRVAARPVRRLLRVFR